MNLVECTHHVYEKGKWFLGQRGRKRERENERGRISNDSDVVIRERNEVIRYHKTREWQFGFTNCSQYALWKWERKIERESNWAEGIKVEEIIVLLLREGLNCEGARVRVGMDAMKELSILQVHLFSPPLSLSLSLSVSQWLAFQSKMRKVIIDLIVSLDWLQMNESGILNEYIQVSLPSFQRTPQWARKHYIDKRI